jgi:hypothetical protein
MKKISFVIGMAFLALSFQNVTAQTTDTNHVEIKKKVKAHTNGSTTIKTKIKGSGTAATAGVNANSTRPVVVNPPAQVTINTPPPPPPAEPKPVTTTTTVTTKTPVVVTKPVVTTAAKKTTTTTVVRKVAGKKPVTKTTITKQ